MRSDRAKALVAVALAALAVLTTVLPDWIEFVFGINPDGGSAAMEVAVVLVCTLAAGTFWAHRRVRLRRSRDRTGTVSPRAG